jgi:hypothetical protein
VFLGLIWVTYDFISINFLQERIFKRKAIILANKFHLNINKNNIDEFIKDVKANMDKDHEGLDFLLFENFETLIFVYHNGTIKEFQVPENDIITKEELRKESRKCQN